MLQGKMSLILIAQLSCQELNAQYHQHMFSLQVNPAFDGLANSVLGTDIAPSSAPVGSPEMFAGNAFTTKTQFLRWKGPVAMIERLADSGRLSTPAANVMFLASTLVMRSISEGERALLVVGWPRWQGSRLNPCGW